MVFLRPGFPVKALASTALHGVSPPSGCDLVPVAADGASAVVQGNEWRPRTLLHEEMVLSSPTGAPTGSFDKKKLRNGLVRAPGYEFKLTGSSLELLLTREAIDDAPKLPGMTCWAIVGPCW